MNTPPTARRLFFWAVTVAIPIAFLVTVELLLTVAHYGVHEPLVKLEQMDGREVYAINRSVARRYFGGQVASIPEPADDKFEVAKSDTTIRIFCLGESTMAGFPFEFNATAPSFLRDRLRLLYPDRAVEVINLGVSAIGSTVVREFVEELFEYEPDLFILYVGHNEFYGAYGVGSTVGVGGNPVLTRLALFLQRFRTFQLLRDAIRWVSGAVSSQSQEEGQTLMAEVIGKQEIRHGSDLYETARRTYRDNLRAIIDLCRTRGVRLLVSTLVSNVRDHPPFKSSFHSDTSPLQQSEVLRLLEESDRQRDALHAVTLAQQAVDIDTGYAAAWYKLGRAFLRAGLIAEAGGALKRAKDLDVLRFRASEDFQEDLLSLCSLTRVPVARVDSAFEAHSHNGIPGNELLTEHLHPTIEGYFLMARCFAETIVRHNLLEGAVFPFPDQATLDSRLREISAVTSFDSTVGRIRVTLLTHRWPFATDSTPFRFQPATSEEALAYDYLRGRVIWSAARYQRSEELALQRKFEEARRECLAVAKVLPSSYEPLLRIANLYRREGKYADAIEWYTRSYAIQDNPWARLQVSMVYLDQQAPAKAIEQLGRALRMHEEKGMLKADALALAHYLLGISHAQQGDYEASRVNAQKALRYDPQMNEARELLQKLDRVAGLP